MNGPHSPYGKRPGGGITLPDYFRPTPSCTSNNFAPPVADRPWSTDQSQNRILAIAHNSTEATDELADLFGGCVET